MPTPIDVTSLSAAVENVAMFRKALREAVRERGDGCRFEVPRSLNRRMRTANHELLKLQRELERELQARC